MKISYSENGKTKQIELKNGDSWSKFKNTALNSLFAKVDDGDGNVSELEIDALRRQMNNFDSDGSKQHLTLAEQRKLKNLNWIRIREKVKVAEDIYNDVNAKNIAGLPTTGKYIRSHVYNVTTDNATTVFKTYNEKTGGKETIVSAIMTEHGLPLEERVEYAKYLVKTLAQDYKQQGKNVDDIAQQINKELDNQKSKVGLVNGDKIDQLINKLLNTKKGRKPESTSNSNNTHTPDKNTGADSNHDYYTPVKGLNGKIDRDFSQGHEGDCWLLAGIKAISMSPKGQTILDNSVTIQQDGKVRVTLKGVNKTYVYTASQIKSRADLATGDLDVRALEMAMGDYMKEHPINDKDSIDGNWSWVAFSLLTGKGGLNAFEHAWEHRIDEWFTDSQIDRFNNQNHIAVVSIKRKGGSKYRNYQNNRGKVNQLCTNHAYTVKGSDKNNVYLINPWDTSKTISVPRSEFKRIFTDIDEYDL